MRNSERQGFVRKIRELEQEVRVWERRAVIAAKKADAAAAVYQQQILQMAGMQQQLVAIVNQQNVSQATMPKDLVEQIGKAFKGVLIPPPPMDNAITIPVLPEQIFTPRFEATDPWANEGGDNDEDNGGDAWPEGITTDS